VVLTTEDEIEQWMSAPVEEALKLQRPLPDGVLRIVARGERKDDAVAAALDEGNSAGRRQLRGSSDVVAQQGSASWLTI
jgi:hypothetical protein